MTDPQLDDSIPNEGPIEFKVFEKSSQRGSKKLASSDGFTYSVKSYNASKNYTYWCCSKRSKSLHCRATVSQVGDSFKRGVHSHQHPPEPGLGIKLSVSAQVKETARDQVYRPASDIVNTVMLDSLDRESQMIPKPNNLVRVANRHRQGLRPKDPNPDDVDFIIDMDFIKGDEFLQADFKVDSARHIILASKEQLHQLNKCKRWFVDGTFKIVKRPFYQLFSIHGFIHKDECVKQIPLTFGINNCHFKVVPSNYYSKYMYLSFITVVN